MYDVLLSPRKREIAMDSVAAQWGFQTLTKELEFFRL